MRKFLAIVFLGILPLFMLSCQAATDTPVPSIAPTTTTAEPQPSNYPAPANNFSAYPNPGGEQVSPVLITPNPPAATDPEPGKASICGTLYSPTSKMVIPGTQIYLTLGGGQDHSEAPPFFVGPLAERGDISLTTDNQGNFSANNVTPGKYYLVVWAPMTWNPAQVSASDTKPLLFDLQADQKNTCSIVYVSWP